MPAMWAEGAAPTPAQVSAAADAGLFSLDGVKSAGASLPLEYEVPRAGPRADPNKPEIHRVDPEYGSTLRL
jgi:hypothetical protein